MSARVSSILTAGKAVLASTLTTFHPLRYVYDVSKNDERVAKLGYGFIPLEAATPESQVNGSYTLDHRFEVVLTDLIARGINDDAVQTTLSALYDKADDVFKAMVASKAGLPLVILNVFSPSFSAPEILREVGFVALRMQMTIKYRSALN